ncbi:MAG: CvpA family protein [Pseudomonadota bacterium]
MENFTLIDGGVAGVLIISAILAYSRGLVRELLGIAGWIVAAIVAFIFTPDAVPLIQEIPVDFVQSFFAGNCGLSMIAAFGALFALTLIVFAIFAPVFAGAIQRSALGAVDQGLGFLFGLARGVLLVLVAFILYDFIVGTGEGYAIVEDSTSRGMLAEAQVSLTDSLPIEDIRVWFETKYNELDAAVCQQAQ